MKIIVQKTKGESDNMLNPERTNCVLPVPSEETCQGGCEGNTTHAVEAIRPGT